MPAFPRLAHSLSLVSTEMAIWILSEISVMKGELL